MSLTVLAVSLALWADPGSLLILLLIGAILLTAVKYCRNLKYRDFAGPSPMLSLPLIGHGYLLGEEPVSALMEMAKKYGDVFRLDIGPDPTIFICKRSIVAEAFKKEVFNGRFWNEVPIMNATLPKGNNNEPLPGVASSEGPKWYEQRKFMLRNLSDLGMGKKDTMEEVIEQEVDQVIEKILGRPGVSWESRHLLITAVNNVVWRITTGKATKQDDPELKDLTLNVTENFKIMDPGSLLGLLQMNSLGFTKLVKFLGLPNMLDTAKKIVDMVEHAVASSQPNEYGNYIERGLFEVEKSGSSTMMCFNKENGTGYLASQLADLFFAGTDTTSTMLEWILLYLVKYPDVQERIHQEIEDRTDGNCRKLSLGDKPHTHYLCAFLDEASRFSPMAALPPAHKTLEDTVLQGMKVPKKTQVMYFMYGMNQAEEAFPNPDQFKPERFLDKNGKYCKDEELVLFGLGKRRCPAEVLARAELFLFTGRLLQSFKLRPSSGEELSLTPVPGLVFQPKNFRFTVEERKVSF